MPPGTRRLVLAACVACISAAPAAAGRHADIAAAPGSASGVAAPDRLHAAYAAVAAQEGHPLSGTWGGEWRPAGGERTRVTVVMTWDGTTIGGLVNPGPNAVPLTSVVVNWADWTVRLEGQRTEQGGKSLSIAAEGRLEDIGSYQRKIVGTWTQDGTSGELVLTRE
jgi:hypothetical protein